MKLGINLTIKSNYQAIHEIFTDTIILNINFEYITFRLKRAFWTFIEIFIDTHRKTNIPNHLE